MFEKLLQGKIKNMDEEIFQLLKERLSLKVEVANPQYAIASVGMVEEEFPEVTVSLYYKDQKGAMRLVCSTSSEG